MLLYQRRDDPRGALLVVYDHSKPSTGIQRVLAIEPLAARFRTSSR